MTTAIVSSAQSGTRPSPVASFRLSRSATPSEVTKTLKRNGIAVLDEFLDGEMLDRVRRAVDHLFTTPARGDLAYGASRVKRLFDRELSSVLAESKTLAELERLPLVRATCDDFFGPTRWQTGAIYAMHYRDTMPVNEKFHIDPSATVKFFYYLGDVGVENGAFTYCVGSHREGFFRMRCAALEGQPGAKAIPDDEVHGATPIEGAAGTLVVFNSIGIHRGGAMLRGTERRTLTYHFDAKAERRLTTRLLRKLRRTSTVDYLCSYNREHQSRAIPYSE